MMTTTNAVKNVVKNVSSNNTNSETIAYFTKDVLVHIPVEQMIIAFPIDGNKGMYPKGMFNVNKCV